MTSGNRHEPRPARLAEDVVVIRESSSNRLSQLAVLLRRTCIDHVDVLPGAAKAVAAGLDPWHNPKRYDAAEIRGGPTRIVQYTMDGTVFIVAQGSAGVRDNGAADNFFCDYLAEQMPTLLPRRVWAQDLSRLVRDHPFLPKVIESVLNNGVERVITGIREWDLDDPGSEDDLYMTGAILSRDKRMSTRRKLEGLLVRSRMGQWPLDERALPPGYALNEDREVVLNPDEEQPVRDLLVGLQDPALITAAVPALLDSVGLSPRHGHESYTELDRPSHTLGRVRKWVRVYETGQFVFRRGSRRPDRVAEAQTEWSDERQRHEFVVPIPFPLPEGGWLDDPQGFQIIGHLFPRKNAPSAPRSSRGKPFHGLPSWIVDGREYKLVGDHPDYYFLRSRSEADANSRTRDATGARRREWEAQPHVSTDATVRIHELDESFVDAVTHQMRNVVVTRALDLPPGAVDSRTSARVRDLQMTIAQVSDHARRARENSNETEDDEMRRAYRLDAEKLLRERRVLDAELREIADRSNSALGDEFQAEVTSLARAITGIRRGADRSTIQALHHLIVDFRVAPPGATVRWTARLRLEDTTEGELWLGPLTGVVPNRGSRTTLKPRDRDRLLAEALLSGAHWDELDVLGGGARLWPMLSRGLRSVAPFAPAVLIVVARMPAQARIAIGAGLGLFDVPPNLDPLYCMLMAHTYTQPKVACCGTYWGNDGRDTQKVIDAVDSLGGHAPWAVLQAHLSSEGLSLARTRRAMYAHKRVGGHTTFPAPVEKEGRWNGGGTDPYTKFVSLRRCPHPDCSGRLTKVVRLPETPDGLLCPDCMRCPSRPDLRYPCWYRDLEPFPRLPHLPEWARTPGENPSAQRR